MKFKIFILLISFSIYLNEEEYIPLDIYSTYIIKPIIKDLYKLSLDIEKIETNNIINLDYSSPKKIYVRFINYYWSEDNYKNIKVISNKTENKCNGRNLINIGKREFTINCLTQKNNSLYKSLIIEINTTSVMNEYFIISHKKITTTTKTILIIVFIFIFIFTIIIGVIFSKKKKKNINLDYYLEDGVTNDDK